MTKFTLQLVAVIWLCGVAISPCVAIMYVWVSPTSGITHMEGDPPPWFRNPDYRGKVPRTLVYHNGKLIDQIGGKFGNDAKPELRQKSATDLKTREIPKEETYSAPAATARIPRVDNDQNLGIRSQAAPATPSVIETQIEDDFDGWDGETIVKLMNGQIWQQTEFHYDYHYAFMPKVLIFLRDGGYKMKVDGVKKAVGVERLR